MRAHSLGRRIPTELDIECGYQVYLQTMSAVWRAGLRRPQGPLRHAEARGRIEDQIEEDIVHINVMPKDGRPALGAKWPLYLTVSYEVNARVLEDG